MKNEIIIKKWLDNELTSDELKAFKKHKDYDSLMKLSEAAVLFKAPEYDENKVWKRLETAIEEKRNKKNWMQRIKPFARIAVLVVFGFFIYSLFVNKNLTVVETIAGNKEQIVLPDRSKVDLNSLSTLQYLKRDWVVSRKVTLEGEAYFDVEKGAKFDVETSSGLISVLGTKFNVYNRENLFEVTCFEGKVRVTTTSFSLELVAGERMRLLDNKLVEGEAVGLKPTWMDQMSTFKSVPLSYVLAEFELQYNVNIVGDVSTSEIFTGSFIHSDMEIAIKSITLPFNLTYKIEDKLITLYKSVE